MKLSQYAKMKGVVYRTAWNWWKKGIIECEQDPITKSIFLKTNIQYNKQQEKIALYARVSSYEKKKDLDGQLERLRQFSFAKGYIISKEIKEIASGMNDNREKLNKVLLDISYGTIIVENKDRLTRFGFNYIKNLLEMQGRKVIVLNEKEENKEKDLMTDLISIITSFCCRLYGLRKGQNKANKIKLELEKKEYEK
jgi:predicted site-specific integrase-resolvase